jgi:hypothetical protein
MKYYWILFIEEEPTTISCYFQLVLLLLIIRTTSFALIYANIHFHEGYILLKTVGTGVLPSALKRPGLETDQSPPTSAEVKNMSIFTTIFPIHLEGVLRD